MKTYYWSRKPGKFVNKTTGEEVSLEDYKFSGTIREWYETFTETCIGATNRSLNSVMIVNPDILSILECSVLYRPTLKHKLDTEGYEEIEKAICSTSFDNLDEVRNLETIVEERLKNKSRNGFYVGVLAERLEVYMCEMSLPRNEALIFSYGSSFEVSKVVILDMILL